MSRSEVDIISAWLSSVFFRKRSVSYQKPLIELIAYLLKKGYYFSVFFLLCLQGVNPMIIPWEFSA